MEADFARRMAAATELYVIVRDDDNDDQEHKIIMNVKDSRAIFASKNGLIQTMLCSEIGMPPLLSDG
jgi:hypothetical protein